MAHSPDSDDHGVTGEGRTDEAEATEAEEEKPEEEEVQVRPEPEFRWVELRTPRQAVEIGQNGRILTSHYHERYDAWEVLLETYEGELSDATDR